MRRLLRYRFDNLLTGRTWAIVAWLGLITLAAVLASSVLLAISGVALSGSEDSSWIEDFWQSLLRTLDSGTMAGDTGWGRRILALVVTLVGILITGTLIGIIASGVEQRVDELRRGRSAVIESGHVAILGGTSRLPVVVEQLALAYRHRRGNTVVVLADTDPTNLSDRVHATVPDLHGTRLVFRFGDPTRPADLSMVGVHEARTVIVLEGEADAGDAGVIRTVLAAGAALGGFDRVPIVVEVRDPEVAQSLVSTTDGAIHPLVASRAIARVTAFALRESGLNQVIQELTDFRGADIYTHPMGDLAGHSFREGVTRFADARVLGRLRADGRVELNPQAETRLEADDRLVVLADDDRFPSRSSGAPGARMPTERGVPRPEPAQEPEHFLVIGWNALADQIIGELGDRAQPGSTAQVLYDPELIDRSELPAEGAPGLDVTLTASGGLAPQLDAITELPRITSIVLLGYGEALSPDEADSRTLLTLMSVRRQLGVLRASPPRLVVELADVRNVELAQMTGADDYIVSDALSSRLLAQLAEQPERRPVLLSLYGPDGASIHLVPADGLGLSGATTCAEVVAAAYAHGCLVLGWRQGGELTLNPHETERVTLGDDDRIVVIG